MRFIRLFSLIASCGLMLSVAHAETAPNVAATKGEPHHHNMMKADANGDGKISFDEFRAAREKRDEKFFKHMDANGDGFIDEGERKVAFEKMREFHQHHKAAPAPEAKP